jgi:hypothetical protein
MKKKKVTGGKEPRDLNGGCSYKRKLVPRRSLWIPKTKSHLREGIKWHIQKVRV